MSKYIISIRDALLKKVRNKLKFQQSQKKTFEKAGNDAIKEIKELVAKGNSPIKGEGRFPAYKNPKTGYPATVRNKYPSKKSRPVNLYLSGKFLKQLKVKVNVERKPKIQIGFFDQYGKTLEQGHREGANGQPSRPIIPAGNETFKPQVISTIKKLIAAAIKKMVAK
jgi:hypothetical protein